MTRISSGHAAPRTCRYCSTRWSPALAIARGETLVDGTFGAGGYTRAMLAAGAGRVIGFDRDPDAIANGPSLVPDVRLTLIEERFSQMDRVLAERGIGRSTASTLDIGVSSMQLDQADRGFSFQADGPLDMRMAKSGQTAAEFLNEADEAEIARVLKRIWRGAARPLDRPRHRRRAPARAHRRAGRDRPRAARLSARARRPIPRPAPSRQSASI